MRNNLKKRKICKRYLTARAKRKKKVVGSNNQNSCAPNDGLIASNIFWNSCPVSSHMVFVQQTFIPSSLVHEYYNSAPSPEVLSNNSTFCLNLNMRETAREKEYALELEKKSFRQWEDWKAELFLESSRKAKMQVFATHCSLFQAHAQRCKNAALTYDSKEEWRRIWTTGLIYCFIERNAW